MGQHSAPLVAASLLSADFSALGQEAKALQKSGADWLHWDIMDGHFVPAITFGPLVQAKIRPLSQLPFDTHLMVSQPERHIEAFAKAGSSHITFHAEAAEDPLPIIQKIKSFGLKAGLSIKPKTPLSRLDPYLKHLDIVLIMTVEPGLGGQAFLPQAGEKAARLKMRLAEAKNPPLVCVDGGVSPQTAPLAGAADTLIAGSFIFQSGDYKKAIQDLKAARAAKKLPKGGGA